MRNVLPLLALVLIAATFTSGCAGPEEKLGRGIRNTYEVVQLSGLRRSVEQTSVWNSPAEGYTTGVVKGVNLSLARTGVGLYEILTFPFPPYHPVFTKYISPEPIYPGNYMPNLPADPIFATDQYIGYSGGTFFSFIPGSQFNVYGNY
jgi:putative exosortase-associated protein (TIGR04073 family)